MQRRCETQWNRFMIEKSRNRKRFFLAGLVLAETLVIIFALVMVCSVDNRKPVEEEVLEEILPDFTSGQTDVLTFVQDGTTQVVTFPVSLMRGEAFRISFDLASDSDTGGMVFVDLYREGQYDPQDAEFRRMVLKGRSSVTGELSFGMFHPVQCELRIFTLGNVSAEITGLRIERIRNKADVKDVVLICLLIGNAAAFLLLCGKIESKRKARFLFAGIVCMQVLLMLFWMQQKSNFYVDELYSMEKAQYFSENPPVNRHLFQNEDWEEGTWMDVSRWQDKLILSPDEELEHQPASIAIKSMLTDRNYNGLLNLVQSLSPGEISKYPGIVLNIVIFVLTQMIYYALMVQAGIRQRMALTGVFWFGFCGITISMAEFIRFYTLTNCLFLLALLFHLGFWKSGKYHHQILYILGVLGCLYFGYKNSELIAPLMLFLAVFFLLGLLVRREYHKALLYGLPVFGGGTVYLMLKTDLLDIISHFAEHAQRAANFQEQGDRGRLDEMMMNFQNMSAASVVKKAGSVAGMLVENLIGRWELALFLPGMLLVLFVIVKRKKRHVAVPEGFVRILGGIVICDLIFLILGIAAEARYYFFLTGLILLVILSLADRLSTTEMEKAVGGIVLACITVGVLYTNLTGKIDFIYREDRMLLTTLGTYQEADAIVDTSGDSFQRALYDCVVHAKDDTQICPVSDPENGMPASEEGQPFLLYQFPGNDISVIVAVLQEDGTELIRLGESSASEVYLCR